VGRGELSGPLTGAREAVRWPGYGGEGGGGQNLGSREMGAGMSAVSRGELFALL
jgi:hypothetical protein